MEQVKMARFNRLSSCSKCSLVTKIFVRYNRVSVYTKKLVQFIAENIQKVKSGSFKKLLMKGKPPFSVATQFGFIPAARHFSNLHFLQLRRFFESIRQASTSPVSTNRILHWNKDDWLVWTGVNFILTTENRQIKKVS